jgi:hypothetical protein
MERLIFLTDRATWIREWIADHYPPSRSIPDLFHVMEHLYQFAGKAFPLSPPAKALWCELQKKLLPTSQVETVISNIASSKTGEKDRKQLTAYYQNNKKRMKYARYRTVGCGIIGSDAIEFTHRTVMQKKMKLSGQCWSADGVKHMLRLRIISMNRQ